MNTYGLEVLKNKGFTDIDNQFRPLHANTDEKQCVLLYEMVKALKPKVSLEIGLAQGTSSIFICQALKEVNGEKHIVMDPFQDDEMWRNEGIYNLQQAGLADKLEFHKEFSQTYLPQLYLKGVKVDFIYIDSTKVFDHLLVDSFFLIRMLNIGGVISFDDCSTPSVRKLMRTLVTFPHLEIFKKYKKDKITWKRQLVKKALNIVVKNIPFADQLYPTLSFETDESLGVDYHFIAFRKIHEDSRNWDWYSRF